MTLGLLLLAACGPKPDPLAPLKQELAQVEASEPQAALRADDEALGTLLGALVGRPQTAPGPLGMRVVLVPTLERSELSVHGTGGVGVELQARLVGTLDIAFPLASQDDLAFDGTLRAPLAAQTRPDPLGSWVLLGWTDPSAVVAQVTLPAATEQLEALTTGIVQGVLTSSLAEPKGALIPRTPWGAVTGVELEAIDGDLVGHITVSGAPGRRAEAQPPPPGGMSLTMTDASLLGLLQGLAASSQDDEAYVVEPTSVKLTPRGIDAQLLVHRRTRKARFRRYRVEGPVVWDGGRLRIDQPTLELVEQERWKGGVRVSVGEKRALTLLEEGVGGLPSALVQPLSADLALQVDVEQVVTQDGQLVVSGPVQVVPRTR